MTHESAMKVIGKETKMKQVYCHRGVLLYYNSTTVREEKFIYNIILGAETSSGVLWVETSQ